MKLTQHTIIHLVLGLAVLLAIALLYPLLADSHAKLSPSALVVFGGAALGLLLMAFVPRLLRRWKHLPPPPTLSRSDISFCVVVTLAGCALAVFGIFSGMWWLMTLGIMLAPLSFMFRWPRA